MSLRSCTCSSRLLLQGQGRAQEYSRWTTAATAGSSLGIIANRRWATTSTATSTTSGRNPLGLAPRPFNHNHKHNPHYQLAVHRDLSYHSLSLGHRSSYMARPSTITPTRTIMTTTKPTRTAVLERVKNPDGTTQSMIRTSDMLATGMKGVRGFKTSSRRELAGASVAFGAMALLKSSAAITCIAGVSRLLLTLLPFAAMKTVRMKFNRINHAAHFVRLQTPGHIAEFYERELSNESPVEPDCRSWREMETPEIKRIRDDCPFSIKEVLKRMVKSKTTLKAGRWPPWGREQMVPTSEQELDTKEFKTSASRTEIWNQVIAWTINLSRERTGLSKTSETIDVGHKPWKKWTVFYLPQPSPGAMKQIQELSVGDREKLYELRRWFAKEKLFVSHLRRGKWIIWTLIWLPVIMFGVVAAFSLERVPFTGRFRLIMLSPEEEEGLTDKLRGPGWYKTVLSMFTTAESPAPPVVPMADWRWNWVNGVMRRLERGIEEHCRAEKEGRDIFSSQAFTGVGPKSVGELLPPPPPDHPLHPRSRGSAVLHGALEGKEADHHIAVGPPYALLLLDNEERNAMSYGFGEGGSGGVVVYTGILDEILSSNQQEKEAKPVDDKASMVSTSKPASGIWEFLFGRSSSGSHLSDPSRIQGMIPYPPEPTEEQTLQLALVLAHELSHLVLSHHLESLSWSEIVIPGATGLGSDLIRTILYPITIFLGPFVNDAINDITKKKAEETTAYSDIHFSVKQEREADVVSLRILAYAGFDPKSAVQYWSDVPQPACTSTKSAIEHLPFQFLRGTVHDEKKQRFQRLLDELERWRRFTKGDVAGAWKVAACFIPISFGWAAGDVSLAAYIQSTLAKLENIDPDVSALGAVMAFLYVTYIVLYAVLSAVLGKWVDKQISAGVSAREVLKYVGGTQFSILCVLVLLASCIPRGAISFNPQLIEGHSSNEEESDVPEADEYNLQKDQKEAVVGAGVDGKDNYVNGAQVPSVNKYDN